MAKKTSKRRHILVRRGSIPSPKGVRRRWIVLVDDVPIEGDFRTQLFAASAARALARRLHRKDQLVQLVIRKRNGQIKTEHTYGDDPVETKG